VFLDRLELPERLALQERQEPTVSLDHKGPPDLRDFRAPRDHQELQVLWEIQVHRVIKVIKVLQECPAVLGQLVLLEALVQQGRLEVLDQMEILERLEQLEYWDRVVLLGQQEILVK